MSQASAPQFEISHISECNIEQLEDFQSSSGERAKRYRLRSQAGIEAEFIEYGAILRSLLVPVEDELRDLVLGFDTLDEYLEQEAFIGSMVGPYANRIAQAHYTLDKKTYNLEANEGENILHSGVAGLHLKYWNSKIESNQLILQVRTPANEAGFPGMVDIELRLYFSTPHELAVDIRATPSEPRPISITNHSYFNLNASNEVSNQRLLVMADTYLAVGSDGIPNGEAQWSEGEMRFDGHHINGRTVDHHYVSQGGSLKKLARLSSDDGSLSMTLSSDAPGLQIYTGHHLPHMAAKDNSSIHSRSAICLEPQEWPNAPNIDSAPDTICGPDKPYFHRIRYCLELS